MKRFLATLYHFASAGIFFFLLLMIIYLITDPFKVLYNYDRFIEDNAKAYVVLNRDYVSTTTFDNNYKTYHYNAFILGNSRSIFYEVSDWYEHIGANNSAYHFDAASETLYGLHKKAQYLDSKNVNIENVLLILDEDLLKMEKSRKGPISIISPQLVDNKNIINFHFTYIKAFYSPKFFIPILYYKLTNDVLPIYKHTLDYRERTYNPITNEVQFGSFEKLIAEGKFYTNEKRQGFYSREKKQYYSEKVINVKQKKMLQDIFFIFKKHNTNYKVIISPLYDQIKLNKSDLDFLKAIFGKQNVFDFSGINNFTADYKNYYEWSHYRPHIAKRIMELVYTVQ